MPIRSIVPFVSKSTTNEQIHFRDFARDNRNLIHTQWNRMVEKEWERTGLTYEKLLKDCHPPPSLTKDDEFYMNCSLVRFTGLVSLCGIKDML